MGFFSNLQEKDRAARINAAARSIFEAFARVPDNKYRSLAVVVENEVEKMMKEEKRYRYPKLIGPAQVDIRLANLPFIDIEIC